MTEKLLLVIGLTTLCMLSPGPDMVLVMRNTLTRDRRAGAWTALGVLTGNLVHIAYCALGVGWLISTIPVAHSALRYGGALYLFYLGVQGLRSRGASLEHPATPARSVETGAYLQGLFNNLLNPKGILFYLGVFSQLIGPDTSLAQSVLLIAAMMAVSAAFWVVFVQTLHLSAIRDRIRRWGAAVDRAFGVVLIALALQVALLR